MTSRCVQVRCIVESCRWALYHPRQFAECSDRVMKILLAFQTLDLWLQTLSSRQWMVMSPPNPLHCLDLICICGCESLEAEGRLSVRPAAVGHLSGQVVVGHCLNLVTQFGASRCLQSLNLRLKQAFDGSVHSLSLHFRNPENCCSVQVLACKVFPPFADQQFEDLRVLAPR